MNIDYISAEEFQQLGYLHEVNRRVLHPLGLALEIHVVRKKIKLRDRLRWLRWMWRHTRVGASWVGGVWDYRDDPEGMNYGDDLLSPLKAAAVRSEWAGRRGERVQGVGYMVQPVKGGDGPLE